MKPYLASLCAVLFAMHLAKAVYLFMFGDPVSSWFFVFGDLLIAVSFGGSFLIVLKGYWKEKI